MEFSDDELFEKFRETASIDGGIHRIERVLLFDSLEDMLICHVNEKGGGRIIRPMSDLKEVLSEFNLRGTPYRRYQYHGDGHGVISGFFSYTDALIYVYPNGEKHGIASVSQYNKAHFLCDLYDDDEKVSSLLDWASFNVFWKETVRTAVEPLMRGEKA